MRLVHIIVYVIVLVIIVGAAVSYISANNAESNSAPASASERIEEDDPRFDCRTMGNKVCGLRESNERFRQYDEAFNCFAEVTYTEPELSWNVRVERCIP